VKLYRQEGEPVKKGDPLVDIKPDPAPKDYAEMQQKVKIDLEKEKGYENDVRRYHLLEKNHVISPNDQEMQKAISDYEQARLQREVDQQQLSLIENGKANIAGHEVSNTIISPVSGDIVQQNINLGDPVVAQTDAQPGNILFMVSNMQSLIFKGQISEIDASKVHLGTEASLNIAAYPEKAIQGTLTKVALQSTQQDALNMNPGPQNNNENTNDSSANAPFNTGFRIEISKLQVPKNLKLRSGFSATADIIINTAKETLLLPERVLQFEEEKPYVWLPSSDRKGLPHKQSIKIGISDGNNIQILSGLQLGQKVLEYNPSIKNDEDEGK
jgi:HlyD family secretion protein